MLASIWLAMLLVAGCGGVPSGGGAAGAASTRAAKAGVDVPRTRGRVPAAAAAKAARLLRKRPATTTSRPAPTTTRPRPAPRPTSTTARPGTGGGESSATEREVLALVNAERAKAGCEALREDARLVRAARLHSQDMLARGYFSHNSPDAATRTPSDRARLQGYPAGVGENIAAGYPTPEAVVDGWMGSAGHRANILNCDYRATGVGFASGDTGYRTYWTQDFGSV